MRFLLSFLGAVLLSANASFAACGGADEPCSLDDGTYHIIAPEGPAVGALMFLHGWGSSGRGILRMSGMVRAFNEAGYAVIAPNGTPRNGRSGGRWLFRPGWPGPRDDFDFLVRVKNDAAERFGFDADRVLLSGFSIGGSMASYVACSTPDAFAAYAPVAGGLWRPHPESCAGPVKLLHTHGWKDAVMPLEGRLLRGTFQDENPLIQGDAFATMEIWRMANHCVNHKPDRFDIGDRYWTRGWDRCVDGSALDFALHQGGHSIPRGWSAMALDWFETHMGTASGQDG